MTITTTTTAVGEMQTPRIGAIAFAGAIGTIIEWYDFLIYGTAAALVFNKLFFPNVDPRIGTLAALGTFAVGFLARPIGGAIFGHCQAPLQNMGTTTEDLANNPTKGVYRNWRRHALFARL